MPPKKPPAGPEEVTLDDAVRAGRPVAPAKPVFNSLLTFDSGTVVAGGAYFVRGELRAACMFAPKAPSVAQRVSALTALVRDWVVRVYGFGDSGPAHVWIEFPEVYLHGPAAGKINPRDILWVAASAGAILGGVDSAKLEPEKITEALPKEWKHQMNPDAHNEMTWDALVPAERRIVLEASRRTPTEALLASAIRDMPPRQRPDHNVLDAVGLGLKKLQRIR